MMQMHDHRDGKAYYIIPPKNLRDKGGKVEDIDATRLLALPTIQPANDGLFPGISQTFKMRSSQ
jgi:hypothetical protein